MQASAHPHRASAFTLIELLVVIAIIAILAAILFPVFAQAREQARQTVCSSNTRQVGMAVRMYVQDYDEIFPIFYAYNTQSPSGARAWSGDLEHKGIELLVMPYSKNRDLFKCPNDLGGPSLNDPQYGCPGRASYQACYGSSYRFTRGAYSIAAYESSQNNFLYDYNRSVSDASFTLPAETRIIRDEMFPFFTMPKYGYYPDWYKQWHGRGGGVVFADGHAKFTVSSGAFDQQVVCPSGERSGDLNASGYMYYWDCD
jgi:prepilin-type N-terminal cleavage/methylation domain-containing protein/prepilin-type processing-associated H-X9-DG protein